MRSQRKRRLKQQKAQEQRRNDHRLKKAALITVCILFACCAALSAAFGVQYGYMKIRCTGVTEGNNLSLRLEPAEREALKHEQDPTVQFEVKTDDIFTQRTVRAEGVYYAKKESIKIYYDPQEPEVYYLEHELSDLPAAAVTFALLAAASAALGLAARKAYLRELQTGQE